jgi:anti-sigma B factor antagonist
MTFHEEELHREEVILKYLRRQLDPIMTEAFESHYLTCDECFEELRASQLLIEGLTEGRIRRCYAGEIAVLQFTRPVQLTRRSAELGALSESLLEQRDTKVLIDLSRVSRIDSAGLGLLMSCYSHAVRNQGALKLLNPNKAIRELLHVTKIDAVLETYSDEQEALQSFTQR